MAYIGVTGATSSSISVCMAGLDTNYESADRVCTWYLDGVSKGTAGLGAKISTGGTFTFLELRPDTSYGIASSITAPKWAKPIDFSITVKTKKPAIAPWSWTASNGSASAAQTQAAYQTVNHKGKLGNFSYLVWNDMVDKVKEILSAKGLSWDNAFAGYSSTKMTSTDRKLTAARFNSLRYNIGANYSTGINTVNRGDIVYGRYFTTLTDCMNAWI